MLILSAVITLFTACKDRENEMPTSVPAKPGAISLTKNDEGQGILSVAAVEYAESIYGTRMGKNLKLQMTPTAQSRRMVFTKSQDAIL